MFSEGLAEGLAVVLEDGGCDEIKEGASDGVLDKLDDGLVDGCLKGSRDGDSDGSTDSGPEGSADFIEEGTTKGTKVGIDGKAEDNANWDADGLDGVPVVLVGSSDGRELGKGSSRSQRLFDGSMLR